MKTGIGRISALAFFMTVLVISTAFSEKTLQKSFPVGPGGALKIHGERCHIFLEGSSRSDIYLQAECGKDIENHYELSFEQGEESLEVIIKAIYKREDKSFLFGLFKSTSQRFDLKPPEYLRLTFSVPQDFNPQIKDSRGSIEIRSISGRVEVNNSRGKITCEGIAGPVTAHNSRGGIALTQVEGTVEAKNSRGSIDMTNVSGDSRLVNSRGSIELKNFNGMLEASNSRGNIKIAGLEGGIKATNSRGHIEVKFCTPPTVDCQLSASRGDIELYLPPEKGAEISAEAHRGKIASDIPLLLVGEVGEGKLEGRIAGGGGPRIKLITSRGNIRIKTTSDNTI